MKETLVSPGVLTIENDQSFITERPMQAGAAIIGPTVKGPVGIPQYVLHIVIIQINLVLLS